jgi:hypothetical protein
MNSEELAYHMETGLTVPDIMNYRWTEFEETLLDNYMKYVKWLEDKIAQQQKQISGLADQSERILELEEEIQYLESIRDEND